jgi:hypothetical protein
MQHCTNLTYNLTYSHNEWHHTTQTINQSILQHILPTLNLYLSASNTTIAISKCPIEFFSAGIISQNFQLTKTKQKYTYFKLFIPSQKTFPHQKPNKELQYKFFLISAYYISIIATRFHFKVDQELPSNGFPHFFIKNTILHQISNQRIQARISTFSQQLTIYIKTEATYPNPILLPYKSLHVDFLTSINQRINQDERGETPQCTSQRIFDENQQRASVQSCQTSHSLITAVSRFGQFGDHAKSLSYPPRTLGTTE